MTPNKNFRIIQRESTDGTKRTVRSFSSKAALIDELSHNESDRLKYSKLPTNKLSAIYSERLRNVKAHFNKSIPSGKKADEKHLNKISNLISNNSLLDLEQRIEQSKRALLRSSPKQQRRDYLINAIADEKRDKRGLVDLSTNELKEMYNEMKRKITIRINRYKNLNFDPNGKTLEFLKLELNKLIARKNFKLDEYEREKRDELINTLTDNRKEMIKFEQFSYDELMNIYKKRYTRAEELMIKLNRNMPKNRYLHQVEKQLTKINQMPHNVKITINNVPVRYADKVVKVYPTIVKIIPFSNKKKADEFVKNITNEDVMDIADEIIEDEYLNTTPTEEGTETIGFTIDNSVKSNNIPVRDNKLVMYSIGLDEQNRVSNECAIQFLLDGIKNASNNKYKNDNITRDQIKTVIRENPNFQFDDRLANEYYLSDIIYYCEMMKWSLTLFYPSYAQYMSKIFDNHRPHLHGLINNGHISIINNQDVIKNAQYSSNLNILHKAKWTKDTKYVIQTCTLPDIPTIYNELVNYEKNIADDDSKFEHVFILTSSVSLELIKMIIEKEKLLVENVVCSKKIITGFSYKRVFVELSEDANDVLNLCRQTGIVFVNQSLVSISNDLMQRIHAIPTSSMNKRVYEAYSNLQPYKLVGSNFTGECNEIDTTKDYANTFLTTQIRHFLFDYTCDFVKVEADSIKSIEDIEDGEYIISSNRNINLNKFNKLNEVNEVKTEMVKHDVSIEIKDKTDKSDDDESDGEKEFDFRELMDRSEKSRNDRIHLNESIILTDLVKTLGVRIMNSDLVKMYISIGAIELGDLIYFRKAICYLPKEFFHAYKNTFCDLVETDSKAVKRMINSMVGCLGTYKKHNEAVVLDTDFNVIQAMQLDGKINLMILDESNGLYLGVNYNCINQYVNKRSLYYDIVQESTYRMLCLEKEIKRIQPSIKILGYNTDAIYISKRIEIEPLFESCNGSWGTYKYARKSIVASNTSMNTQKLDKFNIDDCVQNIDWKPAKFKCSSYLMTGPPGSGKSHTLINEIIPRLLAVNTTNDYVLTAPTHKACSNLIAQGIHCKTVSLMLAKVEHESDNMLINRLINKLKNKTIIVDEIALASMRDLFTLYGLWLREPSIKFIFIGDFNQLPAVDCTANLLKCTMLYDMVRGNLIELNKVFRYNLALKEKLDCILYNGYVSNLPHSKDFNAFDTHICYTHKMRVHINHKMMLSRKPKKDFKLLEITPGIGCLKQNIYLYKGLPIVCVENTNLMHNREEYLVSSYDDEGVSIENMLINKKLKLTYSELTYLMRVSYCVNAHVCQSATINGKILIHEINKYDKNMAYTVLSRATALENICVAGEVETDEFGNEFNTYVFNPFVYKNECPAYCLTDKVIGYIYHLKRNGAVFYVGQTNDVTRRFAEHRQTKLAKSDTTIHIVYTVYENENINLIEEKEIKRLIGEGVVLENKQNTQSNASPKKKSGVLMEGTMKKDETLKGSVYHKESKKTIVYAWWVDGSKKEKEFRYIKCGYDVAMQKALAYQVEMSK